VPEVLALPADDEYVSDASDVSLSAAEKLMRMAGTSGDISAIYSAAKLAEIGETVVTSYERDLADRKDWEDTAREALDACSQEQQENAKTFPWANASNMRWPLLTIAAMQFNARMYPAVVKGDEAVLVKIIGQDNGKPVTAPNPSAARFSRFPSLAQTASRRWIRTGSRSSGRNG
jgi:hypothetical protein